MRIFSPANDHGEIDVNFARTSILLNTMTSKQPQKSDLTSNLKSMARTTCLFGIRTWISCSIHSLHRQSTVPCWKVKNVRQAEIRDAYKERRCCEFASGPKILFGYRGLLFLDFCKKIWMQRIREKSYSGFGSFAPKIQFFSDP